MKSQLYPLAALLMLASCRPDTSATTGTPPAQPAADSAQTALTGAVAVAPPPSLFSAADTLSRPMRELVAKHNLANLWQHRDSSGVGADPTFQGFFGPDHYRFGMFFSSVKRDPRNPAIYHVAGKNWYTKSKNVRPFTGTLTVRRITPLNYPGFLKTQAGSDADSLNYLAGRTYTARAQLQLQEERAANSGIFEGEAVIDFFLIPGQAPGYVFVFEFEGPDDRLPTRGGQLIVRGNRRNVSTGEIKSFLVSPDLSAIASDIFKDFMLDERMGEINPKYAKLGWNEYWRNEEWWVDSPKPKLGI